MCDFFHCKLHLSSVKHNIRDIQYVKKVREPRLSSPLCGKGTFFVAMLSVPFVPLSIWPRSNIYVSLLNSSPVFPSWFLLSQSLTTFALLYTSTTARLSAFFVSLCSVSATDLSSFRTALSAFLCPFMFSLINYNAGGV